MRRPSHHSKDPEERRLGVLLQNYIRPSGSSFNPEFKKWLDENCPIVLQNNIKEAVVTFMALHKRRPNRLSGNPEEVKLYTYRHYVSPKDKLFDPQFAKRVEELCPRHTSTARKEAILEFIKVNGRKPYCDAPDVVERQLARSMGSYTSPSQVTFDPGFRVKLNQLTVIPRDPWASRRKNKQATP